MTLLTKCQHEGCYSDAVYVAARKTDGAERVVCDEVSHVVALLARHGVSNMREVATQEQCGWPLPHRDKHLCGCVCTLLKGHDGRHACTVYDFAK